MSALLSLERFRLLYVCHANECRSPMAERLTQRMFADRFGAAASELQVISAGTHARPGRPHCPPGKGVSAVRHGDPRRRRPDHQGHHQNLTFALPTAGTEPLPFACVDPPPLAGAEPFELLVRCATFTGGVGPTGVGA